MEEITDFQVISINYSFTEMLVFTTFFKRSLRMNVHSLYYRPYSVMLLFAIVYKVSNGQNVAGYYDNFLNIFAE